MARLLVVVAAALAVVAGGAAAADDPLRAPICVSIALPNGDWITALVDEGTFGWTFAPPGAAEDQALPPGLGATSPVEPGAESTSSGVHSFGFELQLDSTAGGVDVRDMVAALEASVADDAKRPPKVKVIWGSEGSSSSVSSFDAAIASVSSTYTLFLADGSPVRAKVTVTMRDARRTLGSDTGAEPAC